MTNIDTENFNIFEVVTGSALQKVLKLVPNQIIALEEVIFDTFKDLNPTAEQLNDYINYDCDALMLHFSLQRDLWKRNGNYEQKKIEMLNINFSDKEAYKVKHQLV